MSQTASGVYRKETWYNKNIFPLIPLFRYKKGDEHNTASFTFRWLIFTAWSLDCFQLELSVNADTHWGIGIKGLLPYLRWVIAIPCPENLSIKIDNFLNRKPKEAIKEIVKEGIKKEEAIKGVWKVEHTKIPKESNWVYGSCNGIKARKQRINGVFQYFCKEDITWKELDRSWWYLFKENKI